MSVALTEEMIEAGTRLVRTMEQFPLEGSLLKVIDAAFWARATDEGESRWRFFIASPGVSFEGPRRGYDWVQHTLHLLSEKGTFSVVPFDVITIADTNNPVIDALRKSFGPTEIRDHRSNDKFFGAYYFDEIFITKLDPVITLDCTIQNDRKLRWARGDNHAYVIGVDLYGLSGVAIIGHGTVKKSGELHTKMDLPAKYRITSCQQILCDAITPSAAYFEGQEPEWRARMIRIKQK